MVLYREANMRAGWRRRKRHALSTMVWPIVVMMSSIMLLTTTAVEAFVQKKHPALTTTLRRIRTEKKTDERRQVTRRRESPPTSLLEAFSSTASYLDSLSFSFSEQEYTVLGATSKYLDTLSSFNLEHSDMMAEPAVSTQQYAAEQLQQATNELSAALTEMTASSSVLEDGYNMQYDAAFSQYAGSTMPSTTTILSDNVYTTPSAKVFSELSEQLQDLSTKFNAEVTQQLQSTAEKVKGISQQMPSSPRIPNPMETMSNTANSMSSQFQQSIQGTSQQVQSTAAAALTPISRNNNGATFDDMTATQFAAAQGFDANVKGVVELILATLVSAPRALLDELQFESNPNMLDDVTEALRRDLLQPLIAPLQQFGNLEIMEQAQALLLVLQRLLAVLVAIPRTLIESLTGETVAELWQDASTNFDAVEITKAFLMFAKEAVLIVAAILKLVVKLVSAVVGVAAAGATTIPAMDESDVLSNTAGFLANDLLPTIVDGFVLLIRQSAYVQQ